MRSAFAGSALTTVLLVALPFFGGTAATTANLFTVITPSVSTAPLISPSGSRADAGISSATITVFVEHMVSGAAAADAEHASQNPEGGTETTGTTTVGSAGGSTSGGTTGGTTSGGTTGGGTGGGTTAPSPAPSPSTSTPPVAPPPPAAPVCPAAIGGSTAGAPSKTSPLGVAGTTSDDINSFAARFNQIRVANCLPPIPFANFRYDSCMEQRLFWMAEDPSDDPMSAWGHIGSVRSDGLPSVGCDGNLAGGSGNTGATVAQKWWDSASHRASLYKPTNTGSTAGVCILFAMTHGGVPNEPYAFVRAAARSVGC